MTSSLKCKWMSLNMMSPIVVSSLTPMSHARLKEHIEFFEEAASYGAGAVVLPSINPSRHGTADFNHEEVDVFIGRTGLKKNEPMTFAIQGPVDPNIVSVEYGLALAENVKMKLSELPIIGSVSNLGNVDSIIDTIRKLDALNIDGIELNFSCPNVETSIGDTRNSIPSVVKKIKNATNKPLSLKITPYQDYYGILNQVIEHIDSLTLTNAYIGLAPPNTNGDTLFSPFKKTKTWSPGGVYGPFERLLTFNSIFRYKQYIGNRNIDIACVGGLVSGDDAIQAMLLGANIVQVSSGLIWNGLSVIKNMNDNIKRYLVRAEKENVQDIIGEANSFVCDSADSISYPDSRWVATIKPNACKGCKKCYCTDRLCFAITRGTNNQIVVDQELCSGCGWCVCSCPYNAIEFSIL